MRLAAITCGELEKRFPLTSSGECERNPSGRSGYGRLRDQLSVDFGVTALIEEKLSIRKQPVEFAYPPWQINRVNHVSITIEAVPSEDVATIEDDQRIVQPCLPHLIVNIEALVDHCPHVC